MTQCPNEIGWACGYGCWLDSRTPEQRRRASAEWHSTKGDSSGPAGRCPCKSGSAHAAAGLGPDFGSTEGTDSPSNHGHCSHAAFLVKTRGSRAGPSPHDFRRSIHQTKCSMPGELSAYFSNFLFHCAVLTGNIAAADFSALTRASILSFGLDPSRLFIIPLGPKAVTRVLASS